MVSPVFTIPFVVALVVVVVVGSSEDSLARLASFTLPVVSDGVDGSVSEGAAVVSDGADVSDGAAVVSDGAAVVSDGAAVVSEDVVPDS